MRDSGLGPLAGMPVVGHEMEAPGIESKDLAEVAFTESPGALRDDVEHRLGVRG